MAEQVQAHLHRWALWLDPGSGLIRREPSASPFGDALATIAAVGVAARPAVHLGPIALI